MIMSRVHGETGEEEVIGEWIGESEVEELVPEWGWEEMKRVDSMQRHGEA